MSVVHANARATTRSNGKVLDARIITLAPVPGRLDRVMLAA